MASSRIKKKKKKLEMEETWEGLDVDDSDLPSLLLLRPCIRNDKRHRSQTLIPAPLPPPLPTTNPAPPPRRFIPGPVGQLQAAMLRKRTLQCSETEEPPIPTQEYITRAVQNPQEFYQDDDDFKSNPWIRAIQFLNTSQSAEEFVLYSTPLSSVDKIPNADKINQVVAVISSCTPNGLGDMIVTLKDPTGKIDGTIHRKVLNESEFAKDISISSVLILDKVSMFQPSRTTHYLNITCKNVVKVFSKDIDCALRQTHQAPKVIYALPTDCSEKMRMLHKTSTQEFRSTDGIVNEIGQVANAKKVWQVNNNQKDNGNPFTGGDNCDSGIARNISASIGKETIWAKQSTVVDELFAEAVCMEIAQDIQETLDNNKKWSSDESSETVQHQSTAAANFDGCNSDEILKVDKLQNTKPTLISKTSLPRWTDEQLNELFADDFDDDGSLL